MKKFLLTTVVAVGSVVLVGVVVVGAILASGGLYVPIGDDGYTESESRAMRHSCDGDRATLTIRFARHAGRVIPVNGGLTFPDPDGCMVTLAVPKSAGPDPMEAIDEAVSPRGWERTGEATWVNTKGFTVTASTEEWADPEMPEDDMAEYDIRLKGRPGD
jgi:hypothetical protein